MLRLSIFLLASACVLLAQPSKEVHRTLPLAADGLVSIDTHKGSVQVTAWDRDEVLLDVRIVEDGGWLAQDLRRAEVEIRAGGRDVRLESKWDLAGSVLGIAGSAPAFHYTLRVPRRARLKITDHKSEITIDGVAGDVDLIKHKGTARLRGLEGALRVNTHKGDIRAEFTRFNRSSRIETHKGDIVLTMPRDARFTVRQSLDRKAGLTSDYPMMLRSRGGSSVSLSPVNGGGPELSLKSHKGSFRLRER